LMIRQARVEIQCTQRDSGEQDKDRDTKGNAGHTPPKTAVAGGMVGASFGSSFAGGRSFSVMLVPCALFCDSVLASDALFDACLCCQGCCESGKGTLERTVRIGQWPRHRI
jgi:hypothetical protein